MPYTELTTKTDRSFTNRLLSVQIRVPCDEAFLGGSTGVGLEATAITSGATSVKYLRSPEFTLIASPCQNEHVEKNQTGAENEKFKIEMLRKRKIANLSVRLSQLNFYLP